MDFGTINLSFLNDLTGIKLFTNRSVDLRNGTYSGRLFSVEDAEVDKSLREVVLGLGASAKDLYGVYTPKGFWKSRTSVLIGLDLRKGEDRFSSFWRIIVFPSLAPRSWQIY